MDKSINSKNISVYLALGSNLGDRLANLQEAIRLLPPFVIVQAESPIYQTIPWGYKDQPDFLNQVILAETSCAPLELLSYLKEIELRVGRTPTFRYGPRVVDMDIIFYGKQIIDLPGLKIPHPKASERVFVLVPLNDLEPDFVNPENGQTVSEMLAKLDVTGIAHFKA